MDMNPKTDKPPLYTAIIYGGKLVNYILKSEYDALEKEAVEFAKAWGEDYRIIKGYSEAKALAEKAQSFLAKHKEPK